jgi:hypothetical protein
MFSCFDSGEKMRPTLRKVLKYSMTGLFHPPSGGYDISDSASPKILIRGQLPGSAFMIFAVLGIFILVHKGEFDLA